MPARNTENLMAPTELPDFEGTEVVEARAIVRNAGDGLSEAMSFEPFAIHQGDKRYLVLDVTCIDVQHPFADKKKPDDGLARVHILRADTGVFLDATFIAEAVEKQRVLNAEHRAEDERRRKAERGEFPLPGLEGAESEGASVTDIR